MLDHRYYITLRGKGNVVSKVGLGGKSLEEHVRIQLCGETSSTNSIMELNTMSIQ